MLAHVEEVRHVHPHPAWMTWEALVVGALALLAVAVVVGARAWRAGRHGAAVDDV
jgi:hypothetical protein